MLLKKNIKVGKVNLFLITIFSLLTTNYIIAENLPRSEAIAELSILDKVSSKNTNIKIQVGEDFIFQNLNIKVLKCYNSKFDDDPEVTAFMQVIDKTISNNDQVFVLMTGHLPQAHQSNLLIILFMMSG